MEDPLLKRKLLERQQHEVWHPQGRSSLHFENIRILSVLLRAGLKSAGLLSRGERNARNLVLREIGFEHETLPKEFSGFRILHISDLHAGGVPGLTERICETVQGLEVDVCVLTGDYRYALHGPSHDIYKDMERILASLNSRLGAVGILGNHDSSDMIPEFERMGLKMLINEAWEVRSGKESIWLIGLDDPHYYGCDNLPGALAMVPRDAFKVLLVHTPELFKDAAEAGVNLYLCGHTHGGQICLPVVGPLFANTSCSRRYVRGPWQYKELKGYTSAGAGSTLVPVRFHCPPEVGLIELKRSETG